MPTSDLPQDVTIEEIERHLDRVALEIEATGALCIVPLFEWLEEQLEKRKKQNAALDRIAARVRKSTISDDSELHRCAR